MTMVRTFFNDNWLPKSVLCLRDYDRHKFLLDLIAGVTIGLVALPLAMAFAIASGLTPQAGIYCAIVTGFLISALGGSKTQIGGPTGAFVVVVAGIVAVHGVDGLFMCTVMAGVLLVQEAGGMVSHFDGGKFTLDSREVLATNGLIHGEMVHLFTEMFAGRGLEAIPTPAEFAKRRMEGK